MSEFYANNDLPKTNEEIVVELMEEKMKKLNEKLSILKEVKNIEDKINQLDKMIYSICKHVWTIDRSSYGEHTEYYCKKCNCYK